MKIRYENVLISLEDLENQYFEGDEYFQNLKTFLLEWRNGIKEFEMLTSGSTGVPKKITITRSQMRSSAQMTIEALNLSNKDHALCCLNTQYIGGRMMIVRAFEAGMDLSIIPPSVDPIKGQIGKRAISFTAMVPYQLQYILQNPNPEYIKCLNDMRCIIVGGAPISNDLQASIELLTVPVFGTYGMTETISHIALRKMNGPEKSEFYEALPGVELSLDTRGCLQIKSRVNSEVITTNDIVDLEKNRFFKWKGRIDNVINSGGIKIIAEEIESTISSIFNKYHIHRDFFICGLPHSRLGEEVVLVVEGYPLEEKEEIIISDLKSYYSNNKLPKSIKYITQFLKTPSNKIDKVNIIKSLSV